MDNRTNKKRKQVSRKKPAYSAQADNDTPVLTDGILCWNCGSSLVLGYQDGTCICQECGLIFGVD